MQAPRPLQHHASETPASPELRPVPTPSTTGSTHKLARRALGRATALVVVAALTASAISPQLASAAPPAKPAPAKPAAAPSAAASAAPEPTPAPGTYATAPVEVLSFASNDAVDEAAALTDAFKHALLAVPGITVGTKSVALEAVALTLGCDDPMAASCAPKLAADVKSERIFYGIVKKTPPNKLTATLIFYNAGQIHTVVKTYDAGPVARDGAAPELKKLATDAIIQLAGPMIRVKVDVTVTGEAATERGEIYENGTKIGDIEAGHGKVDVTPGNHQLEVRIKGYGVTSATVEVSMTGAMTQVAPMKLARDPEEWKLYAGYGAVGVGAVFLALGVVASANVASESGSNDFKSYSSRFSKYDGSVDVCANAHAGIDHGAGFGGPIDPSGLPSRVAKICDDLKSNFVQQIVFYSLGAVFAGGGTYLLVTKKKPEATTASKAPSIAWSIAPSLSTTYQGFSLVGRF